MGSGRILTQNPVARCRHTTVLGLASGPNPPGRSFSVALVHRLTVVTHNQREFGRVPRLKSIDWVTGSAPIRNKIKTRK